MVLLILVVDSEAKGNSIIKTRVAIQIPNKIKPKDRQMLYAVLFGGHDLVVLMTVWCS